MQFPDRNVDCEYNRNVQAGAYAPKMISVLEAEIQKKAREGVTGDELLSYSTYPDIIVHRRAVNSDNLLVIEVKKRNNSQGHEFDHTKLMAFTESAGRNSYQYRFGVFILLYTARVAPEQPELTWFINGEKIG